jgi:hypothetical protein
MAETPDEGAAIAEEIKENPSVTESPSEEVKEEIKEESKEAVKEAPTAGYWPEDWREEGIKDKKGKDGKPLDDATKEKLLKRLSRYASIPAAIDALISAQDKISSGLVKIPGKDATKEEIAEYRKSLGVPEKPEGYDLTLGKGMVVGDEDKPIINSFLNKAHEAGYTPDQVKTGLQWYYDFVDEQKAAQYEADQQLFSDTEEALRQEWGVEYKANRNLMANYLATDFSEGIAELIVGARLADGTMLANHPEILKGFVSKARKENPMGAMVPGSGTKQHEAMLDEISSIEKLMRTDREAYNKDKRMQDRYLKLVEARDKSKK